MKYENGWPYKWNFINIKKKIQHIFDDVSTFFKFNIKNDVTSRHDFGFSWNFVKDFLDILLQVNSILNMEVMTIGTLWHLIKYAKN